MLFFITLGIAVLWIWIIINLIGRRKKQHNINKKIRNVMEKADLSYEDLYCQPEEKRVLLLKGYISQITTDKRRSYEKGN